MPKAPPPKSNSKDINPHVLKRHQACHQCRKRKMKCSVSDAKRPCSSCVRSHAYALMHAPPGSELPSGPECTFDEVAELVYSADDDHEERYTTLESRIIELEYLLRTRDPQAVLIRSNSATRDPPAQGWSSTNVNDINSLSGLDFSTPGSDVDTDPFQPDQFWATAGSVDNTSSSPTQSSGITMDSTTPMSWPRHLPPLEVVRLLSDAFFAYHLHAHDLLHAPSFMTSLSYPPNHPQFPIVPLLHVICAIGSSYTSADKTNWEWRDPAGHHSRGKTFSDDQALYAKRLLDDNIGFGSDLLQHVQANILLTWYYWWQARWVEVYTRVATTLRISVALGLNLAPQFASVSATPRPASLIPPPKSTHEDEKRRNTFWVAYALERQYGSSNGWALSLDDQDVFQLLPLSDKYDTSGLLNPSERQLSHTNDVLLIHPPAQTDAFVLYIKSTMLLSRVKNFNLRTRAKYFAEDPSIPQGYPITDIRFDPRQTPEFGAMTSVALAFTDSIPTQYKNPLQNGVVNPHIYSTLMAPPITLILLHEPYAMVGRDSCLSAYHILTSARSIATLVHTIASTSYDCTKLGLFPVFAWFTSARVLTRFLRAALEEKYVEQIGVLKDEISFILRSLKRLSDRAPLAGRYARMLEDHVLKTCGAEAAASICPLDPTEMPGTIGFAPEMQEGDAADKILSMRLASLHAALSAGSTVTPSLPPFWPSSVTANTVE